LKDLLGKIWVFPTNDFIGIYAGVFLNVLPGSDKPSSPPSQTAFAGYRTYQQSTRPQNSSKLFEMIFHGIWFGWVAARVFSDRGGRATRQLP